jgi:hypothetical protein
LVDHSSIAAALNARNVKGRDSACFLHACIIHLQVRSGHHLLAKADRKNSRLARPGQFTQGEIKRIGILLESVEQSHGFPRVDRSSSNQTDELFPFFLRNSAKETRQTGWWLAQIQRATAAMPAKSTSTKHGTEPRHCAAGLCCLPSESSTSVMYWRRQLSKTRNLTPTLFKNEQSFFFSEKPSYHPPNLEIIGWLSYEFIQPLFFIAHYRYSKISFTCAVLFKHFS